MNCPLCHNYLNLKIDKEYFQCTICRALVKDIELLPSRSEEKERYQEHNNDVNDPRYQKFTSPITNYILQHFAPGDEGLDYGSGTGPVISKMLQKHKFNVQQYDPYFANQPELLTKKYDYIFACEVAEHFYNPKEEFGRLKEMLKPGGALILMTLLYNDGILFRNWYYRKDPTHVFIYTKQTLHFIRNHFNFKKMEMNNRLIVFSRGEKEKQVIKADL